MEASTKPFFPWVAPEHNGAMGGAEGFVARERRNVDNPSRSQPIVEDPFHAIGQQNPGLRASVGLVELRRGVVELVLEATKRQ